MLNLAAQSHTVCACVLPLCPMICSTSFAISNLVYTAIPHRVWDVHAHPVSSQSRIVQECLCYLLWSLLTLSWALALFPLQLLSFLLYLLGLLQNNTHLLLTALGYELWGTRVLRETWELESLSRFETGREHTRGITREQWVGETCISREPGDSSPEYMTYVL